MLQKFSIGYNIEKGKKKEYEEKSKVQADKDKKAAALDEEVAEYMLHLSKFNLRYTIYDIRFIQNIQFNEKNSNAIHFTYKITQPHHRLHNRTNIHSIPCIQIHHN